MKRLAVDSSTLIAFAQREDGLDIDRLTEALTERKVVIPQAVVTEVLSNPHDNARIQPILLSIHELAITEGFWQRAGNLRYQLLKQGRKAKLADTLIAQSCIDHGVPLITRDRDFDAFAAEGGLKLAC